MKDFMFKIKSTDELTRARVGLIQTPHGKIETPAFVPVGTQASIKSLTPEEMKEVGVQLFFVNIYHVYLRPGIGVIKKFGGLHRFMGWQGPLVTDSGGFQVFSFGRLAFDSGNQHIKLDQEKKTVLVKISDNGVEFRSHWDGTKHFFTPEKSSEIQHALGADIILAFDECVPYPTTYAYAKKAMERTHAWAERSLEEHRRLSHSEPFDKTQGKLREESSNALTLDPSSRQKSRLRMTTMWQQALYGVIQGSVFEDLRKESAKYISSLDFDGIAIGGVSVGESKEEMRKVVEWVVPLLPPDKPRHLLGVGEIDDIFTLVEQGIDTFDCVQPTRLARMGKLLVGNNPISQLSNNPIKKYELDITKTLYKDDPKPLDEGCACYTCTHFSRAYLHHLFRVRELLAYRLATIHNVHFVNTLVGKIRQAIKEGTFLEMKRQWLYD